MVGLQELAWYPVIHLHVAAGLTPFGTHLTTSSRPLLYSFLYRDIWCLLHCWLEGEEVMAGASREPGMWAEATFVSQTGDYSYLSPSPPAFCLPSVWASAWGFWIVGMGAGRSPVNICQSGNPQHSRKQPDVPACLGSHACFGKGATLRALSTWPVSGRSLLCVKLALLGTYSYSAKSIREGPGIRGGEWALEEIGLDCWCKMGEAEGQRQRTRLVL